jgi:hypothetical protein
MHETNHIPPEKMSPEQRRQEVAFLLAQGLVRLREAATAQTEKGRWESAFVVGFACQQSVHRDSTNNTNTESK